MDLKITITDENDDVLSIISVYQDGSDSEGAEEITRFIEDNFEVESPE